MSSKSRDNIQDVVDSMNIRIAILEADLDISRKKRSKKITVPELAKVAGLSLHRANKFVKEVFTDVKPVNPWFLIPLEKEDES